MNEYRQLKGKNFALPEPVYKQVIWMLKDLNRMKERLDELKQDAYTPKTLDTTAIVSQNRGLIVSDVTGRKAVSIVALSNKIEAIEDAFDILPTKYRKGIYDRLVYDVPYPSEVHINTWRKWQQILVYEVALNLDLL